MEPDIRVLAARVLANQVRHLTALMSQAHEFVEDPPKGSPARADLDHINRHRETGNLLGLRAWAHMAAARNVHATEEHLWGVKVLLDEDRLLPLPAMALARSVYEAVINTCWLVDVDVPTEQRLARWAGRLLHDSQEPTAALESFGDAEAAKRERERVVGARSLGQDLMERAGFELKAKGGDKFEETAQVTYRDQRSSLTPNIAHLVDRFTPTTNLWHLFSGATHSRGWLVSGLDGPATDIVAAVVLPLLETSDALAYETARYFDLDPRPTLQRTHMHRSALLARSRPGGRVAGLDMYRQRTGLPALPKR